VISKRWATLDTADPETKRYVAKIAAKELGEYKLEMKDYKELTAVATSFPMAEPAVTAAANATVSAMMISPSPTFVSSSYSMPPMQYSMPALSADLVLSLDQDFSPANSSDEDEIDYSICSVSNNGNYIPSPGPALSSMRSNMIHPDGSICDPLFELEDGQTNVHQPYSKRCVSPVSSDMNVDIFSDNYFCQLLPR